MKKIRKKEGKKERPILQKKQKRVEEILNLAKNYPVIALLNLQNLPDRILQSSKKKLRDSSVFVVSKNSIFERVFEKLGKNELKQYLNAPTAIVFTKLTPYSLFKFFKENKIKIAAKPGQIAPFDIIIPTGETDLPPGPALSELKNAGINAQIKAGKIVVAKDSVVAKAGNKISALVCKALQKLNILPFEAKINMAAAHDGQYLFTHDILNIDEDQLKSDISLALTQSFNLSVNSSYPTEDNINYLLSNTIMQAKNLALNAQIISDYSKEELLKEALSLENLVSTQVKYSSSSPDVSTGEQKEVIK
jgi:large subunit ribosomal protein L10